MDEHPTWKFTLYPVQRFMNKNKVFQHTPKRVKCMLWTYCFHEERLQSKLKCLSINIINQREHCNWSPIVEVFCIAILRDKAKPFGNHIMEHFSSNGKVNHCVKIIPNGRPRSFRKFPMVTRHYLMLCQRPYIKLHARFLHSEIPIELLIYFLEIPRWEAS